MSGAGRALIVGASSGIGRATAEAVRNAGWAVAASARRADRLEEITGIVALPADVRIEAECHQLVGAAVEALGGLDALVYAAGVVPLKPLVAASAELWHDVFATNVVGAALVTAAAIPHLEAAAETATGRAVFLSSDSVGAPLPGLVPYAASKAALEELVRGWRAEHSAIRFTTLVVGPTLTGMADGWDAGDLERALNRWAAEGYAQGRPRPQTPDVPAKAIVDLLEHPDPPETARAVPGE
ncbi:MAG: SDR family oxidoreductase [Actinobacteria bacterium]|nr:SDR family oxidoreductase [Actinomycetota bacterium]